MQESVHSVQPQVRGIDLHAHTTASDGSLSPTELVDKAVSLGLSALAVTDHDTTAGLSEAISEADRQGLDLVSGVELSVEDHLGRFHLLGYLFDPQDPALSSTLVTIRASRAERNELMAVRMSDLGLPVTMDDVRAEAGDKGEVIARPHFARALMKAGVVSSVQEAFDKYLANGKPLYLPKEVLTAVDASALLHEAGGLAVMAHPGLVSLSETALEQRTVRLVADAGLDGIEAYYSQHSSAQTERFLSLARDNNLLVSGGSDFHGTPKPHVQLGVVYDNQPAPSRLLDDMRARLGRQAP
jgi:3',5'-nucleoside bisphosphate phosphatase